MVYHAIRCNCGHRSCKDWHVTAIAQVHGVSFSREEAEAVARLLSQMDAIKADQAAHAVHNPPQTAMDRVKAAVATPPAFPDDDFEAENDANEFTPPQRLAVRRERVAKQARQPHTGTCECTDMRIPTVWDDATGCRHCTVCGGIVPDRKP